MEKTNTEKSPDYVEFALIPEESHNEMMTKLKNQYKLDEKYEIDKPGEGNQNMLPQNMPLWNIDYFELKGTEKQQVQKKLSIFSLIA